ncbi:MAG TPA: MHYT domain-containing protein [Nevskia sp.]|nr:MHYT domain-containing protein [Nevskia sp.]
MNGTYDFALVFASYCVAVFASYAALDLGARIADFQGSHERSWLFAGAVAMGTGIWSMHFVGMKSFQLPVAQTFDLALTVLSWVAGVGVSLLALFIVSRPTLTLRTLGAGAVAMGMGICVMHYTGMWAMRMTPGISYDPLLFAASVLIAVAASAAALFIGFSLRRLPQRHIVAARIAAALVMGAAICGMHYTGMAAARFAAGATCAAGNVLAGNWMGLPVALITVGLLIALLLLALMDARAIAERRRLEQKHKEAERVRRLAYFDSVTGLPNRSQLNERLLRQLINLNGKIPPSFSVVYGELRGYRALVDKHGQDRVNQMLQAVAAQLGHTLLEGDTLARMAHDGFVFLLRQQPERSLDAAEQQAIAAFATPVLSEHQTFRLNWGIGSSRYPEHGNSTQSLIRAAMKLQREVGGEAPAIRPLPLSLAAAQATAGIGP